MISTPEPDPLWVSVPNQYLLSDVGPHLRFIVEAYQAERRQVKESGRVDPEISGLSHMKELAELGQGAFAEGVIERAATDSLSFPFPPSLVDQWVSLATPPVGLRSALERLTKKEESRLWDSLASNRKLMAENGVRSSGVPSFFWQVQHDELGSLFKGAPWLSDIPLLAVQMQEREEAPLHGLCKGPQLISKLCEDLFYIRLRQMKRPKTFYPSEQVMEPLRKFLAQTRDWQKEVEVDTFKNCLLPSRMIDLALKLTLLEVAVGRKKEIEKSNVEYGLELAKRFLVRHFSTVSAIGDPGTCSLPDTTDMTDRERAAFLKICEKGALSPTELARSFSRMLASERDDIIASLLSRNLITFDQGILRRATA
ncbi:MAG: hypothetical protein P1U58_10880 [Verrucomicrobiales bacterium]|nr:hypothetical protein [Verrucomicrobiales bacterium]